LIETSFVGINLGEERVLETLKPKSLISLSSWLKNLEIALSGVPSIANRLDPRVELPEKPLLELDDPLVTGFPAFSFSFSAFNSSLSFSRNFITC
jgi:hypothetical protein